MTNETPMTTPSDALCLVTNGAGVCTKPEGHGYGHHFRTMRHEAGVANALEAANAEVIRLRSAGMQLAGAISRIDYLTEKKPNEMEVSSYDVSCDEVAVVGRVQHMANDRRTAEERVRELEAALQQISDGLLVSPIRRGHSGVGGCNRESCYCYVNDAVFKALDAALAAQPASNETPT